MQVDTLRPGTLWQRLFCGVQRVWERQDWVDFAGPDWVGNIMDVAVTDDFHAKQGRSTGRWALQANGRQLTIYLKRHYRLSWWRGLLATLWPGAGWSPGLEEWRHLQWAISQGLPVPAPVAAGEFIGPWRRLQSFLAVEELTGMLSLHHAIPLAAARLDADTFRSWKRSLIKEMVRLTRALHDRRRFHKDLYLCHFYILREDTQRLPGTKKGSDPFFVPDWCGRVHLIDLHRLAHHPWTWRLWQIKDLAELLFSTNVVGVDEEDRRYFWRLYSEGKQPGWVERCILFKRRLYVKHNTKKKQMAA